MKSKETVVIDSKKRKRKIKFIGTDTFGVESKSTKGKFYEVNLKENSCECPHYQYRLKGNGGVCSHLKLLVDNINSVMKDLGQVNKQYTDKEILDWFDGRGWVDFTEAEEKFGEGALIKLVRQFELLEKKGWIRKM